MASRNQIKCNVCERGILALCIFQAHISRSSAVTRLYSELVGFARVQPAVISLTSCAGGSARITKRNPIKNNCWQRCVCAKHVLEAQISRCGDVARLYPELEAVARVLLVVISLTLCAGGSGRWADRKPIKYNCW